MDLGLRVKFEVCRSTARASRVSAADDVAGRLGLSLAVGVERPEPSDRLFHCEAPAARWWEDLVYSRGNMPCFRSEDRTDEG